MLEKQKKSEEKITLPKAEEMVRNYINLCLVKIKANSDFIRQRT